MRPIVNMPEEDRATDIGNLHIKFGKDRACGFGDILVDRQTDIQKYSSQYLATAQPLKRSRWRSNKQTLTHNVKEKEFNIDNI